MRNYLLLFVVSLFSSELLSAAEYDINMSRRAKTGDRYEVMCTASYAVRYVWSVEGKAQPASQMGARYRLSAQAETVLAGETGSEIQIRLNIKELKNITNGGDADLLPVGSVVDVKWENDKSIYLLNGEPVDETLRQAFSYLWIAEPPTYSPDERISGTATKQALAQKWPVNAEALAEHLTKYSALPTQAKNITGFVHIAEVLPSELKIVSTGTALDVQVPLGPELKISTSKMQFDTTAYFPIDLQQRPRKKNYRTTLSATGIGEKDGKPHRLDMTYRFSADYDMKPVP
jgi:hypothetical protein